MTKERRSDLIFGIILFLIGAWFLASQFNLVPGLNQLMNTQDQWPIIIIGVGIVIFFLGLLTRHPGMSIPATIVAGIGGILLWTNTTGRWNDWTYLWTLIPGFVGLGILLSTLLGDDKNGYREGLTLILISAILFAVFLLLFSGRADLYKYWPILVILAGMWVIIKSVFRRK